MGKISITKGKVLKDSVEIVYTEQKSADVEPAQVDYTHNALPHKDLIGAFAALDKHAGILGEFISLSLVPDIKKINPELAKDITVTGYTITGKDNSTLILSAYKTLSDGTPMGFNRRVSMNEEAEDKYKFLKDLIACINKCDDELLEYLNGNKYGEEKQGKLDLQ